MGAGASSAEFGLDTCPLDSEALRLKDEADSSVKQKNYFEAEVKYSEALVSEPKSALLWGLRGAVRHELGEFGQALNDSLTCIALAPTSFFGYYYAGKSAKALQKEHLANDFFQRALALNPSAPSIVKAAKEMQNVVANTPRGATNNVISWTNGKDPSILGHKLKTASGSRTGGGSAGGLYPKMVAGLRGHYITDVGCGMSHCIAVSAIGDCFCWGQNKQGQCGVGVSSDEPITYPVIVPVLIGVKVLHVSCGAGHSVCTTEAAGSWSWGIGVQGQLGHGDGASKPFPVQIESMRDCVPTAVTCGIAHTFILEGDDNRLFAFGWNKHGQLGIDNRDECALLPIELNKFACDISHVSAGGAHTVLTLADGTCYSTGSNSVGQLGLGHLDDMYVFTKIEFVLSKVPIALTACGEEYTIFLSKEKTVYGCGYNNAGQAHPILEESLNVPKHIQEMDGKNATNLVCSHSQVFAMNDFGELLTWGLSEEKQMENRFAASMGATSGSNLRGQEKDDWYPRHVTVLKKKQILSLQCGRKHFVATIVGTKPNLCYIPNVESKFDYVESGKRVKFKIQAVDSLGNERNMGGDAFLISLFNEERGEYYFNDAYVDDNLDGSYDGVFKLPRHGQWALFITTSGEHIRGSPYRIDCEMGKNEQKEVEVEEQKVLDQDKPNESGLGSAREIKQKQIEEERQKIEEEAKRLEELLKQLDEKEAAERKILAQREAEEEERVRQLEKEARKEKDRKRFEEEQRRREEIRKKAELDAEQKRLEKEKKMKEAEEAHRRRVAQLKEQEDALIKQKRENDMKKRKKIMEKLYQEEMKRRGKIDEIAKRNREQKEMEKKKRDEAKQKRTGGGWVVNFAKGDAWKANTSRSKEAQGSRSFGGSI